MMICFDPKKGEFFLLSNNIHLKLEQCGGIKGCHSIPSIFHSVPANKEIIKETILVLENEVRSMEIREKCLEKAIMESCVSDVIFDCWEKDT